MTYRHWGAAVLMVVLAVGPLIKLFRQDLSPASVPKPDDFSHLYLGGHAWLEGRQPYMKASLHQEAMKLYGTEGADDFKEMDMLYPPTAFVALLPFLALPHALVNASVVIMSLAAYGWLVSLMINRWSGWSGWSGWSRYVFIGFAANYAPLHSGLRPRNVAVMVAALVLIPMMKRILDEASSPFWFVMLGLGTAIKPQMGGLFLLLLLLLREWKRFAIAATTVLVTAAVSVGWLAICRVAWWNAFLSGLPNSQRPASPPPSSPFTVSQTSA